MKENVYKHLADTGFFINQFREEVLEHNILPWLFGKVEGFVKEMGVMDSYPDNFILDHYNEFEHEHQRTVNQERKRQDNVRLEKERMEKEKEEEKRKRRAAREAVKKANELKKLKDEVHDTFVAKGEHKEHVLN